MGRLRAFIGEAFRLSYFVFFCELLWPENLAGITPEIKSLFGNFVKCLMIPFYPNPGGGHGRLFDESGTRDDSVLFVIGEASNETE